MLYQALKMQQFNRTASLLGPFFVNSYLCIVYRYSKGLERRHNTDFVTQDQLLYGLMHLSLRRKSNSKIQLGIQQEKIRVQYERISSYSKPLSSLLISGFQSIF